MDAYKEKRHRWLKRLQRTGRNYAYQKWMDNTKDEKVSLKELLKWIRDDIFFLVKWNINLLLQLRAYGSVVKKNSGLSFFQQWRRMAYVVFVVRVEEIFAD